MEHKSGRHFFGVELREIRTSLQDDPEDGYNLDGYEISKFGKEFHKLSFARAKISVARVQLTI